MPSPKVAEMTVEELRALISQLVDERINQHLYPAKPVDLDAVKQAMESIERHRWTPPPGTPSVVEMLREDRDRYLASPSPSE